MNLTLSALELTEAAAFLSLPECRKALDAGGQWALVFGPHTGIGVPVEITVRHPDGSVYSKDITDVGCW